MTRPAKFTEADIRRAVKGALAGGLTGFVVEVTKDSIRLLPDVRKREQVQAVETLPEKW